MPRVENLDSQMGFVDDGTNVYTPNRIDTCRVSVRMLLLHLIAKPFVVIVENEILTVGRV